MSAEHRTLLKLKPQLTALLAHELPSIADELAASGLISQSVCKKMKTTGIDEQTKASQLMDNVITQIELNPDKFKEFIEVLSHDLSRDVMVDQLEHTLKGVHLDTHSVVMLL